MKKFMLRGRDKGFILSKEEMPNSLQYGVWYNLVTPFDWQYFKIKKSSRLIHVYDCIKDKNPIISVRRKRFIEEILASAKSPPIHVKQIKEER